MSNNTPGAGGKGTAGYWGPSNDESKEAAFEARYRQSIPKGVYKTRAHSVLACKVCSKETNLIAFCYKTGFSFCDAPPIKNSQGKVEAAICEHCGERRPKNQYQKGSNSRKNPKVGEQA